MRGFLGKVTIGLLTLGIFAGAGLYFIDFIARQGIPVGSHEPPADDHAPETADRNGTATTTGALEALPPPPAEARSVTPPSVLPGPEITGPLTRIAPPTPPKRPEPPPERTLYNIQVSEAGRLVAGEREILIAGIVPTPRDHTCENAQSGAWPCGAFAATALNRLIRRRAVSCVYRDEEAKPLVGECAIGKRDIGMWLAAQGWADVKEDAREELKTARSEAEQERRGMWR